MRDQSNPVPPQGPPTQPPPKQSGNPAVWLCTNCARVSLNGTDWFPDHHGVHLQPNHYGPKCYCLCPRCELSEKIGTDAPNKVPNIPNVPPIPPTQDDKQNLWICADCKRISINAADWHATQNAAELLAGKKPRALYRICPNCMPNQPKDRLLKVCPFCYRISRDGSNWSAEDSAVELLGDSSPLAVSAICPTCKKHPARETMASQTPAPDAGPGGQMHLNPHIAGMTMADAYFASAINGLLSNQQITKMLSMEDLIAVALGYAYKAMRERHKMLDDLE